MRKLILPLLALLLCSCTASAQIKDSHVVIVIAGSTSIRDFVDPALPGSTKLLDNASAALLNVRAGRPSKDSEPGTKSGFESGCVSLGAGAMATAGAEASRAGDALDEINGVSIYELWKFRTNGRCPLGSVFHTEIAKLARINAAASYRARPGALGSALRDAGITTYVMGSSDTPDALHREAVAVAMDTNGVVDGGHVETDHTNLGDRNVPFGLRTSTSYILSWLDDGLRSSRFLVIDFGDTFRADEYVESCTDQQALVIRREADARLQEFVTKLADKLDPKKDLLIVLSPNARGVSEIEGEKMGAILISGPGFKDGMLTSPSTRRPGVVALTDVAPTVLSFFGIKPPIEMVGRPIQQTGGGNAAKTLLDMNERACLQVQRQPAMRGASVAQSVIVCLVLAAVLFVTSIKVRKLAAWVVTTIAALPLAMLYLPLIYGGGLIGTAVVLVLLTLAIVGLCALIFKSPTRAFVWLCGALVLSLMVDLLRGAPLMVASIASYNIIEGARYYGIGNELMGTMLGAALVGTGMMLSAKRFSPRVSGVLLGLIYASVFVFIAAPELGAKVGGAIAMAPAMASVVLARRGWKLNWRSVLVLIAVTVLLVGAMFAVDSMRSGAAQSHAGRTASMAASGDVSGVFGIFARKLALNFMLVVTSVWSRLLGLSLAGSIVLAWWGKRQYGPGLLDREEAAAAIGCCVGTAAAFIFNDSGVLAGATCSVFLWALLALKLLDQKSQTHSG